MATQATRKIKVAFEGDARGLSSTLTTMKRQLVGVFGANLIQKAVGSVIDLGGAFEESMQKIVGLVGVAQETVDRWGQSLLEMGPKVGKGPKELADALFFVTSAGIRTDEALRIVEESAKVSAAGLGNMNDIVRTVTAAMNAYKSSGLTAAEATNILTGTIREGNLEASTLAPVMGRVIPLASQLGVSFDEVGAAIAAMSRQGASASDATTYLLGIFRGLIKDTGQSKKAMSQFDTSIAAVRDTIEEKGLLSGLESLAEVFKKDEDAATKVFGRIRGLTGYLSLMGDNAGDTRDIFASLASNTNFAGEAFEAISNTANQKFREALARLQVAGTELGAQVLPHIVDMVTRFSEVLAGDTIPKLGELLIAIVETAAGITDTLIPALTFLGDVVEGTGLAVKGNVMFWRNLADAILPGRDAANQFAIALWEFERSGHASGDAARDFSTVLGVLAVNGTATGENIAKLAEHFGLTEGQTKILVKQLFELQDELKLTENEVALLMQGWIDYGASIDETIVPMAEAKAGADDLLTVVSDPGDVVAGSIEDIEDREVALKNEMEAAKAATEAEKDRIKAMREASDPTFAAISSLKKMHAQQERVAEVIEEFGENSSEAAQANIELAEATIDAVWAFDDFEDSNVDEAVRQIGKALGWSEEQTRDLLTQMGLLGSQRPVIELEVRAPYIAYHTTGGKATPYRTDTGRFIPQLAQGGIVTDSTLAELAEAGDPEAVIPLNDQGEKFMASIMENALMRTERYSMDERPSWLDGPVDVDDKTRREIIRKRNVEMDRRRGRKSREQRRRPKNPTDIIKQEQVIIIEFHIDGKRFARKIVKPMAAELKRHRRGLRK